MARSSSLTLRVVGTLLIGAVVACAPAAPTSGTTPGTSAAPVAGGTLNYGQNFPVQIADPANQKGSADHAIFFNVYDRLVELDQTTLQPKPSLATSWKSVDDTTWEL